MTNTKLSRQALISIDQVVKTEGEENTFTKSVLWYANWVTQPLMRMVVKQIMLLLIPFEVDQSGEKGVVDAYSDKLKSLGLYMESFFQRPKKHTGRTQLQRFLRSNFHSGTSAGRNGTPKRHPLSPSNSSAVLTSYRNLRKKNSYIDSSIG